MEGRRDVMGERKLKGHTVDPSGEEGLIVADQGDGLVNDLLVVADGELGDDALSLRPLECFDSDHLKL